MEGKDYSALAQMSDESKFIVTANHIVGINRFGRKNLSDREMHHHFGVSIDTCCALWNLCGFPKNTKYKHLLWVLMFLRLYSSNMTLSSITKYSPKTYLKWTKLVIDEIGANMGKVVSVFFVRSLSF